MLQMPCYNPEGRLDTKSSRQLLSLRLLQLWHL